MRITMTLCAAVILGLAAGCGCRHSALVTGTLESGTFWKNPMSAPNNEGGSYSKGSRVEIYEQCVVVTTSQGLSYVHPHGFYSGLTIKKD